MRFFMGVYFGFMLAIAVIWAGADRTGKVDGPWGTLVLSPESSGVEP